MKIKWKHSWLIRAIAVSLLITTGCNYQPLPEAGENKIISQLDNMLIFEAVGYEQTCDTPKIFVPYGESWAEIHPPSDEQGFYIDDKFIQLFIGWCEPSYCTTIDDPISVPLYKYVPVGLREIPNSSVDNQRKVLVYQRTPIHGKIKITFNIYIDGCSESIPVEYIIDN